MRTPLNAILTLLGNLEHYLKDHEEAMQIYLIIKYSSKMLNYLVHDMLDLF
jgi:signal transduction histidine kinase